MKRFSFLVAILAAWFISASAARSAQLILNTGLASTTNQLSSTNSLTLGFTWQQQFLYSTSTGVTNNVYYVTNGFGTGVTNVVNSITNAFGAVLQLSVDGTNFATPLIPSVTLYPPSTNANATATYSPNANPFVLYYRFVTIGTNQGGQQTIYTLP